MRHGIKMLLATTVACLATGVLTPTPSHANNAQIKVTHAVQKNSGSKASAQSTAANAKASKFKVAVMATPRTKTPAAANSSSPKFIHR